MTTTQGRLPGCQSTNHERCYGELWQCSTCGKTVCHAEGTDQDPALCDDCWMAKHHPQQVVHEAEERLDDSTAEPAALPIQALHFSNWPEPTTEAPDLETIEEWMWEDGGCEATDGCWLEPDGVCPHGHPSWLLVMGLI